MSLQRLAGLALALPEAERVDIQSWEGAPTFRVYGKNFVFATADGRQFTLKLPPTEASWVLESLPAARPAGHALGQYGWVTLQSPRDDDEPAWTQIGQWIRESYRLVAPKRLVALLDASSTIEIRNVNHPRSRRQVDAGKYHAMKSAFESVLGHRAPGLTESELVEQVTARLPEDQFPEGHTAGWWAKAVQLDLEARGSLIREKSKPLRWHLPPD